jgi:pyruvate dehydrogenase E2 component (dihydrolipoamide acetyltransferase)
MTINILMPALSPTMTEGTLAKWLVKEGDPVSSGDVVAEIETDKATMEVESIDEGTVGKILVNEGTEGVPVNQVIAILLEEGEDSSALDKAAKAPAPSAEDKGKAEAKKPEKGDGKAAPGAGAEDQRPKDEAKAPVSGTAPPAQPAPGDDSGNRIFASPLARRMAAQMNLDLAGVNGSGPHGRIVKADVERALGEQKAAPERPGVEKAAEPPPVAAVPAARPGVSAKDLADMLGMAYEEVPNSSMRKTIARRLSEAKQTIPHFYLTVDCQVDELLRVRKELNSRAGDSAGDYKLSVNDFVVRASALALKKVPAANAAWTEQAILMFEHADISVAVATEGGLITPIVRRAEAKGLAEISREMKDLAGRARANKLKPEEYQGGSFSVSNLGMYGIKDFAAIINPPQGCILAVGTGEQRPVVRDGALAISTVMSCTLAVDHRVVDGAIGAQLLAAFKALIEDPLTMLL